MVQGRGRTPWRPGARHPCGTAPLALSQMPSPSNSKVIGPVMFSEVTGAPELFCTPTRASVGIPVSCVAARLLAYEGCDESVAMETPRLLTVSRY